MSLHDLHLKSSEKNIRKSFSLAEFDEKNEKKEFIIEKTYVIEKVLGEGAFGKVNLARHIPTNQYVAIKTLEKSKIIDEKDEKRIAREISILTKLRHPNLIQLLDIIETNESLHLIMEYANGGELFDYIVKNNRLEEKEACRFYQQLIRSIEYIYSKQITHRDIKPENILLDSFQNLKLADFGLGNFCPANTLLQTACGSPSYAPPEMIENRKYSGLAADLWSAGVVLYAMVCGYLPFEDENNAGLYRKILSGEIEYPEWLSEELIDLLKGVLQVDEKKRFSLEEIKNHMWFRLEESKSNLFEQLKGVYDKQINEKILNETVALGFKREEIIETIEKKKHNRTAAVYFLLLLKELKTYHEKINKLSINNEKGDGRRRTWSTGKSPLLKDSKRITAEWNTRIIEENENKNEKIDEKQLTENYDLIEDLEIKKKDESQKMKTVNEEIANNSVNIQKDHETKISSKNESKDKLEESSSETTQIKESPGKSSPNFLEFLQSKSGDPNPIIRKLNNEYEYETKEENILTESLKESTIEEKNTSENNIECHKTEELSTTSPEMIKISRPSLTINYNIVIHETDNFSPNKAEFEFVTCEIEPHKTEEIVANGDTCDKKIIQEELNNLYSKLAIFTKNENKIHSKEYPSKKVIQEEMNTLYDRVLMNHVDSITEKVIIKEKELKNIDEVDFKSKKIIADELTGLYKKIIQKVCEMETAELNNKGVITQELEKLETKLILQELDPLIESIYTNESNGKMGDNVEIKETIKIKEGAEIDPILKKQNTENLPHEKKKKDSIINKSPIIQKKPIPIRVEKKKNEEQKTSENKPKKENKQIKNMLTQSSKLSKEENQPTFEFKSSPLKKTITSPNEKNIQKKYNSASKEKKSIEQKQIKEEKKFSYNKKPIVIEKSNPEKRILPKSEKKVELKKIDSKLRKTEKYVLSEINEEKQGSSKKKETSSNDSSKLEMMYDILRKDKLLYNKIEKALKNPAKDSNLNESKLSNSDKLKLSSKPHLPKSSIHIKKNLNINSGSKKVANQSFNLEHTKNNKYKANLSFSVDNSKLKQAPEKNRKNDFSIDSYKRKEEKNIFELKLKEKLNKFQLEKKNEREEKEKRSRDQKNSNHKMSSDRNLIDGIKPFKGTIEFKSFSSKPQEKLFSDLVVALRSLNIDNIQENNFTVRFFTKKGVEGRGEVRLMPEYDNLCLISFEMIKGEEKEYNGVCFEILKSMKI